MPSMPLAATAALALAITAPVSLTIPAWADGTQDDTPLRGETHHMILLDGQQVAWREAGDQSKPTIVLVRCNRDLADLRMLMRSLVDRYHVVVPDPGQVNGTAVGNVGLVASLIYGQAGDDCTLMGGVTRGPH
ncbi:alpha/beta fold hydrolase [Halovulum sp. GXIMD14794]